MSTLVDVCPDAADQVYPGQFLCPPLAGEGVVRKVDPVYGVWYTSDRGASWLPCHAEAPATHAGALSMFERAGCDDDWQADAVAVVCVTHVCLFREHYTAYGTVLDVNADNPPNASTRDAERLPRGLVMLWAAVSADLMLTRFSEGAFRNAARVAAGLPLLSLRDN